MSVTFDIPTPEEVARAGGWKRYMYGWQEGRCWYCDEVMTLATAGNGGAHAPTDATWEHVTPVRRKKNANGKYKVLPNPELDEITNKVLVCSRCNHVRDTKPLDEFISLLREKGLTRGIVARIGALVADEISPGYQSRDFELWLASAMGSRPTDALLSLPAVLQHHLRPTVKPTDRPGDTDNQVACCV